LPFDVHLMVEAPDAMLHGFVTEQTAFIVVHAEACRHLDRTLSAIRALGVKSGVALNPATPPEVLDYVMDKADQILVMSVNPGFGGQSFLPSAIEKIRVLRHRKESRGLSFDIAVDGGINLDNIGEVVEAGADIIIVGSAILNAKDPLHTMARCKEACHACPR
jgi:ribulose-phosphate 3-epimerase